MKKLTPKEQKFAELCVTLSNQTEAYRQAYDVTDPNADWIVSKASHLSSKDNVKAMIDKIREDLRQEHKITREWIKQQHMEIIDWYKELKTLARQDNLSKEDKTRVDMLKELIKGSDFRGSLDSITKMYGLNEPEKIDQRITSIDVNIKRERD